MPYARPDALVSTEWLAAHLDDPALRILDASYSQAGVTPTARDNFHRRHIPGAAFFSIDDIAAPGTSLPHMLPPPELFAQKVGALGISNDDKIVVYDSVGLSSAGRAWWMFRIFGHENVALLDGGLAKWEGEGRPTEDNVREPMPRPFTAHFDPALVRDKRQLMENLASRQEVVIDARAAGRFEGTAKELWPGRRGGHIPASRNLPFDTLTDPATHRLRSAEEIAQLFAKAGIAMDRKLVASCGSGVTACAVAFGAHLIGHPGVAIYDGSWSEWGLPGETPVDTGPADPA